MARQSRQGTATASSPSKSTVGFAAFDPHPDTKAPEPLRADDPNAEVRQILAHHPDVPSFGGLAAAGSQATPWTLDEFQRLDQLATSARTSRTRLPGGVWQLRDMYDILATPNGGSNAPEWKWLAMVQRLQQWTKAMPNSTNAKLALAAAQLNWGWNRRGGSYADSVTQDQWKGYGQHIDAALGIIKDPAVLHSNDPYLYDLMLQLGTATGADKASEQAIFEHAIAAEPEYYHYYRLYTQYLQPQWYGETGEAVAFAEKSSEKVGGQQGDFIYFELASLLSCKCDIGGGDQARMSWAHIKKGYAAMESLYGTSMLKRNRMALMATRAGDTATARKMFDETGDQWDATVWRSQWDYNRSRDAAMAGQPLQPQVALAQRK